MDDQVPAPRALVLLLYCAALGTDSYVYQSPPPSGHVLLASLTDRARRSCRAAAPRQPSREMSHVRDRNVTAIGNLTNPWVYLDWHESVCYNALSSWSDCSRAARAAAAPAPICRYPSGAAVAAETGRCRCPPCADLAHARHSSLLHS